jgi:predicted transcriptional regulator
MKQVTLRRDRPKVRIVESQLGDWLKVLIANQSEDWLKDQLEDRLKVLIVESQLEENQLEG